MSDCEHAIQPFDKCYLRDEWTNPLTCPYCDLQRHKDALDRVAYQAQCIKDATDMGQQQWERQALYAMFTESGGYIWPIETGEDE